MRPWQPGRTRTTPLANLTDLRHFTSRRDFLRVMSAGGAVLLLPGLLSACQDSSNTGGLTGPGTGDTVTIDFSRGDVAILQFALVLEQLEADFYSQVVANFTAANFSTAEKTILTDIRNHEVIHRDFLKAVLAADGTFTITPTYGGVNLKDRTSVLAAAKAFEEVGIAAYNGAAQYLVDAGNLQVAASIVSVEARHASAIRDLITPSSGDFAPSPFDNASSPATGTHTAQLFIDERLTLVNTPTAFVQGPNGNG